MKITDITAGIEFHESFKLRLDDLLNMPFESDFEKEKTLYALRMKANKDLRESRDKSTDEYLSALRVKYGYAITVHKAQGGEWSDVFIYPEYPYNKNAGRWLYTAVTRASENIYSFNN